MGIDGDRQIFAHLLRRTGFGPTAAEVDAAMAAGFAATVTKILAMDGEDPADGIPAPTFAPASPLGARNLSADQRKAMAAERAAELRALQIWWLQRMSVTTHPLREKATLFWHGHFATSFDKVRRADLMMRQNQLFRASGLGGFEPLTQAVAKDPAMMLWLDTATDKVAHPNENFARELMELFTLGIGNYAEQDVREAARAFTGWTLDRRTMAWAFQPRQHDNGQKTVLGRTGDLGGEDVIHVLVNDPNGEAFVVASVWSHFAYPVEASDPVVTSLLPAYRQGHDIGELLHAVMLHAQFTSAEARTGLVKQPIEWLVGALRAVGVPATSPLLVEALSALGQIPFRPPNVGGWPQNDYWLTTAASLARLKVATLLASQADLSSLSASNTTSRVDTIAHILSVEWSDGTAAALRTVAANVREMVALALASPEFVLA